MKRIPLVLILLCFSTVAQAFTVFSFPNYDWKLTLGSEPMEESPDEDKALRELIESSLTSLKGYSVLDLTNHLGAKGELPDHFLLPSYYYVGISLSNSQVNGDPNFHFFPLAEDFGLVVLQLSGNQFISGGALYFHRDLVDDESAKDPQLLRTILKSITERIPATEQGGARQPATAVDSKSE